MKKCDKKIYIWFNCISRKYPERIWKLTKVNDLLSCTKGDKLACYSEYTGPNITIYDYHDSLTNLFLCKPLKCILCNNETVSFYCTGNINGAVRPVQKQYCSNCFPHYKFAVSMYDYDSLFNCIDSMLSNSNIYEPELVHIIINYMLD